MPAQITLSIVQGDETGKEFVFDERTTCIVGCSRSCQIRIIENDDPKKISRHHCLLDINPPNIRIRDFGSRNGTFVNGELIGKRETIEPAENEKSLSAEVELKDGDEIRIRNTALRVSIHVPVICDECSLEIPDEEVEACAIAAGIHHCFKCRQLADTAAPTEPIRKQTSTCSSCHRDVSGEIGEHRYGKYVCRTCRNDPFQILKSLLESAKSGQQGLTAIKGYSILKELGHGGRGVVCLARHEETGRQVALKLMLPEVAADERAIEDFLREARHTQALQHPNVVRLYDAGSSEGTFFMTLEFCNSGSVDRLVESRGGNVSVDEAVPIVVDALDGLEHAHQVEVPVELADGRTKIKHGLVHRDIKPANIFLQTSGNKRIAKVGDYGFSKAFDAAGLTDHTIAGMTAGTPAFICRQQVINFKYAKPEVDVWAVAASLYNMLTGRLVRDFNKTNESGSGRKDVWQIVLQSPVVPIRGRDANIPSRLADLLDSALADHEELQFKTARDFKQALLAVL